MREKTKNIVLVIVMAVLLFSLSVFAWIKPQDDYSYSERTELSKFPALSLNTLSSGKFMSEFEDYATDQFPLREKFRTLKAVSRLYLFQQSDNNDIYKNGDYISKIEYPLNEDSIVRAADKFRYLYEKYLKGKNTNVYLSLIPDKNAFLAEDVGAPHIDYDAFAKSLEAKTEDFATYIDIYPLLSKDDYYYTDTHWRQEKIGDVAGKISSEMGVELKEAYTQSKLENKFYGVYHGQVALPIDGEEIIYLENPLFEDCVIAHYENGAPTEIPMYDLTLGAGRDPYEMFLSGSLSLITIDNPNAATDRELVIFRDSFGSSIAPYFAEGYSRVTLVDIRYLASDFVGSFVDFENCDVLFLYSTLVLNNSITLK